MNRICPSCQTRMDPNEDSCPHCGYAVTNLPVPVCQSVVRPARRRMPVRIQQAAQIDRTGSSLDFERGIHLSFELFLKELTAQVSEVRVSLASHGDLDFGQDHIMHLEDGTPEEALRECRAIIFEGGGDAAEHHLDGIATMVQRVPWSDDGLTRKSMIGIINAETKPAQCGMMPEQLGAKIKSLGILFYLICEPTPALESLASAAQGLVIPISNDPDVDELKRATATVSKSLTATITSGGTIPMPVS